MSFDITLVRVIRMSALCLLAGSAQASPPTSPPSTSAASADAPVPATTYVPTSGYRGPAPETARPDQGWREHNRLVGSLNSMMLTMGVSVPADHAGQGGADPHAGHRMDSAQPPATATVPATAPASPPASPGGHHGHGGQP